jgi:hypothetical protein
MAGKLVVSRVRSQVAKCALFLGRYGSGSTGKPDASFAREPGDVPDRIAVQRVAALPLRVCSQQRPAFTQHACCSARLHRLCVGLFTLALSHMRLGEFDKPLFVCR